MRELETFFKTLGDGLRTLAQGVNAIAEKLEDLADVRAGQRSKPGTRKKPDREAKTESPKAKTAGERANKTRPKGKKGTAASDIVYEIFDRAKGPVDLAVLAEKTGFEKKRLYNILYRLKSQGKIRNVSQGIYEKV
jgi:predicted Rossmann fold nucleotide-binding protein DprA/Smf involved in DNA uptake